MISACSSAPDKRGPENRPSARPNLSDDYFLRPIAFIVVDSDSNRDFMTTEAEFAEYLADQFEIADKSLNGALSQVEFSVWSEEVMGTRIPVALGGSRLTKPGWARERS